MGGLLHGAQMPTESLETRCHSGNGRRTILVRFDTTLDPFQILVAPPFLFSLRLLLLRPYVPLDVTTRRSTSSSAFVMHYLSRHEQLCALFSIGNE